jgi:hypothetical protein
MRMNKLAAALCAALAVPCMLCAEAPELKNVMPNSWQKITRLPISEERVFLADNDTLIETMLRAASDSIFISETFNRETYARQDVRVYRERAGDDIFYRIIIAEDERADYDGWNKRFMQGLVCQRGNACSLLMFHAYNYLMDRSLFNGRAYTGIDIVTAGNRAKGVMISYVYAQSTDPDKKVYYKVRKGQPYGITRAHYYLMEDLTGDFKFQSDDGQFFPYSIPYISIQASECLVDQNSPRRYGIQSAFDGNPATSYVENTEDDLMEIKIGVNFHEIDALSIINGYAATIKLYQDNNRIKEIEDDKGYGKKYHLSDNILTPQELQPYGNSYIYVTDIFKGEKYNDTCIAELNIKTSNGWLFGDIYE